MAQVERIGPRLVVWKVTVIKPDDCGFWGSRNTRVMVLGIGNSRVWVFSSDFDSIFLFRFRKFGVCTLEITDLGRRLQQRTENKPAMTRDSVAPLVFWNWLLPDSDKSDLTLLVPSIDISICNLLLTKVSKCSCLATGTSIAIFNTSHL
jgi:hypothetical protein